MKTTIYDGKITPLQTGEGRSCSQGTRRTNSGEGASRNAFTLAEVLITLGVIGVVAAVTMPTLLTNIQDRVRNEQVRTVKYKLTQATDKMKSLGKIEIDGNDSNVSMNFVNELKKHMSIAQVCENGELDKCWPSATINAYSGSGASATPTTYNPKNLKKGTDLKALAIGTRDTNTVGIVTGDGVPMLLVYSPVCSGFDEAKTYTWSVENGKPVTNATTNCVSAIFDINGAKGPNKIGQDVRTLNSVFGSVDLQTAYTPADVAICENMKKKYGFQYCNGSYTQQGKDYWVGAMAACDKLGLHLPSFQTLAVLATSRYADPTIGPYTALFDSSFGDCRQWIKDNWGSGHYYFSEAEIRCQAATDISDEQAKSAYKVQDGHYWSSSESTATYAYFRYFGSVISHWNRNYIRDNSDFRALCVGD